MVVEISSDKANNMANGKMLGENRNKKMVNIENEKLKLKKENRNLKWK